MAPCLLWCQAQLSLVPAQVVSASSLSVEHARDSCRSTYHLLKYTLVQSSLGRAAILEVLVLRLETLPVHVECLKTACLYRVQDICRASRDFSSCGQAWRLVLSGILGLAQHVVIVVWSTLGAYEEGSRLQWCRRSADLIDMRNIRRHG